MNRRIAVIVIVGLAALVSGCPQPPSDIIACDPQGCISESNFNKNIVSLLQASPGVVGYVVTVGGLPPVFGGNAVLSPSAAMLPTDITNIASLSKMLTTFAVLKSLSNHNISVDASIFPYLYSNWQSVAGPNINQITFRDLLTHRSGFPNDSQPGGCGGNQTTYSILKAHIQSNAAPLPAGSQGQYSNCNLAMFRELLPQMEQDAIVNLTPDDLLGLNPRAQLSADFYINYVNQNVLGPSGVSLRNCAPTTATAFQMLSYPPPPTQTPNTNWGDWTLSCGGGGWNMSAGDLFLVFNALASGALLTTAQQAELYTDNTSYPGLGWDNTVGNCPGSSTNGQTYYWCKNGGLGGAPGPGIETFAGLFKCNAVPVIVIVNSPITQNITSLVTSAFNNPGTKASGNPQTCPNSTG